MPASRRRLVAPLAITLAGGLSVAGCAAPARTAPAPATAEAAPSPSALPVAAPDGAVDGAADAVIALVIERLETAPQVAASKLFSGQPVTDAVREQVVIDAAASAATDAGADVAYVTAVFADQITASKEVQQALLDGWAAEPSAAPTTAPDLATEVRPVLDRITTELVPALATLQAFRDDAGCAAAVDDAQTATPAMSAEVAAALPTAVASLCD
ncbi:gamma subclass chorismate mutase AroQ [Nakamurella leprariae]|uniref:Gamma subclass chorismate mutase AroQ n=1 Tax=Nakamurella leprariae TaxID=2803911 RepID=A0A938YA93_9ACTN|nr:gamma subclass chorismate mutase AroQ [Nakamurella leprariae]MBM9465928.1 gamma subclass chorismate mutase AroQ [Nakamurella leprariae]